ncbi:Uncharacterised protein [Vibrio cholerae]|nr:Uncharacterised protein [Vibrio cholerae]
MTSHHEDLTNRMLDFLLPPGRFLSAITWIWVR